MDDFISFTIQTSKKVLHLKVSLIWRVSNAAVGTNIHKRRSPLFRQFIVEGFQIIETNEIFMHSVYTCVLMESSCITQFLTFHHHVYTILNSTFHFIVCVTFQVVNTCKYSWAQMSRVFELCSLIL